MVSRAVIADTGPLVAALDRRERTHAWVLEQLQSIAPPLLVCEPVLTEAAHLVRGHRGGADALLSLVSSGALQVAWSLDQDVAAVRHLMHKYADQPMSFADACVVRMAEVFDEHEVFTLDADFGVYRTRRSRPLRLLMPNL